VRRASQRTRNRSERATAASVKSATHPRQHALQLPSCHHIHSLMLLLLAGLVVGQLLSRVLHSV
jgi:hypothetical protein